MLQEKDLDKATIDAYHAYVQRGIRNDLNSIALGPGQLPFRTAIFMAILGFCCGLVGSLLIGLRMRHVYLWDWDAQFLGPAFFILALLCFASATYLVILAKRRSNKYRSELFFRPIGDWGANCVHKSELAREEEMKHDLKSGTTPHKTVKPRSEAYSQSHRDAARQHREGRDNRAYDKSPHDAPGGRPHPHDDRRRGPPPQDDRRPRPPPGGQRGPPPDRHGPPRGPPPHDRRGPPPGDRPRHPDDRPRGPPPGYDDRRGPRPGGPRPPPPGDYRDDRRGPPPPDARRARGAPRFGDVERIPDDERRDYKLILNKSRDESDI